MGQVKDQAMTQAKRCKFMLKPFFIMATVYFVGILAILRANFNYIDDMGRVFAGYQSWGNFSRYLSSALSNLVHADSYLTDVSPLTQLLAICILAAAGVVLLYIVTEKRTFHVWQLAALIPLGLSPYFLECLSYKYDSPYMALSVFASIVPLLFRKKKHWTYGIATSLGIFVVCTTYQAALGIFPMLVILLSVRDWTAGADIKRVMQFLLTSILGYGCGLLLFKIFLMPFLSVNAYVSVYTRTAGIKDILPTAVSNIKKYYSRVHSDFKIEWLVLKHLICNSYVVILVKDTTRNKYSAAVLATASLALMGVVCFGIYPALEYPLTDPRAMYGVGALISFLSVTVASTQRAYAGKVACVLLSWAFFVFSFTYGNALYVQSQYTDYRISMVIDDLNDLDAFLTDHTKTVQINGSIGQSPVLRQMPQDYQMLNRLVPINFRQTWLWGSYGFFHYYGIKHVIRNTDIDLATYNLPVVKDTMYHTIRGDDNFILIELK